MYVCMGLGEDEEKIKKHKYCVVNVAYLAGRKRFLMERIWVEQNGKRKTVHCDILYLVLCIKYRQRQF